MNLRLLFLPAFLLLVCATGNSCTFDNETLRYKVLYRV